MAKERKIILMKKYEDSININGVKRLQAEVDWRLDDSLINDLSYIEQGVKIIKSTLHPTDETAQLGNKLWCLLNEKPYLNKLKLVDYQVYDYFVIDVNRIGEEVIKYVESTPMKNFLGFVIQ